MKREKTILVPSGDQHALNDWRRPPRLWVSAWRRPPPGRIQKRLADTFGPNSSWLLKTILAPSGDQLGLVASSLHGVSRLRPVPSMPTTTTAVFPGVLTPAKAIWLPSGDHRDSVSKASVVTREPLTGLRELSRTILLIG